MYVACIFSAFHILTDFSLQKDNGNSWAAVGYAPPCGGPANTYTFTVYAMPNETTTGIDPMTMKANAIDTYLYNQGALAKATMSAVFLRDNVTACPNKPQVCNFGITNSTQSSGTQTSNSESNTNSNSNSQSSSQVTGECTSNFCNMKIVLYFPCRSYTDS